jgi:dipeptidyl aminopeptidase/acylaminoacyl peptidase
MTPMPMVLLVHGGPWARDRYGYHAYHQWLADRGYAVLSVNFRGSTGFGKPFLNAGDLQWGRKMHDDLLDAVAWAIGEGIADPGRVAIMGGSYGGYATLAGLTFTPEVFCCGVDIVGPSNLETLLATVPPYWAAFFENLARRVGDPRTEDGRALLKERSPLHAAANINKPLLIGQGANDPRVKQAEADQIIDAMRAKGLPVTYVLYPQEGHGFAVPENSQSFNAIAEMFLAAHLGGGCEPVGNDFAGAEFDVRVGAAYVPGLEDAVAGRA